MLSSVSNQEPEHSQRFNVPAKVFFRERAPGSAEIAASVYGAGR